MKRLIQCSLFLGAPLVLWCCASAPEGIPTDPGRLLKPCPSSPNCVSTEAVDPKQRMDPLPYQRDRTTSRKVILPILSSMPRVTIVTHEDHYLHATFRSRIFGFMDDVEFVFDDATAAIHFRSASRTGYSDLGVNRKRMMAISEAYKKAISREGKESPPAE